MEFTISCELKATAEQVYTAWLNSEKHSEMTGGKAKISNKVLDTFTAWDNYISGKNLELKPSKYIKQSWRTTEFDESDEDSIIEVFLEENDNTTRLILKHTVLPQDGIKYENGWKEFYFEPMQKYFK